MCARQILFPAQLYPQPPPFPSYGTEGVGGDLPEILLLPEMGDASVSRVVGGCNAPLLRGHQENSHFLLKVLHGS